MKIDRPFTITRSYCPPDDATVVRFQRNQTDIVYDVFQLFIAVAARQVDPDRIGILIFPGTGIRYKQ